MSTHAHIYTRSDSMGKARQQFSWSMEAAKNKHHNHNHNHDNDNDAIIPRTLSFSLFLSISLSLSDGCVNGLAAMGNALTGFNNLEAVCVTIRIEGMNQFVTERLLANMLRV